ncbi:hypothetical protein VTO42DRAFT_147 [Malbranchea cinnamomea]
MCSSMVQCDQCVLLMTSLLSRQTVSVSAHSCPQHHAIGNCRTFPVAERPVRSVRSLIFQAQIHSVSPELLWLSGNGLGGHLPVRVKNCTDVAAKPLLSSHAREMVPGPRKTGFSRDPKTLMGMCFPGINLFAQIIPCEGSVGQRLLCGENQRWWHRSPVVRAL